MSQSLESWTSYPFDLHELVICVLKKRLISLQTATSMLWTKYYWVYAWLNWCWYSLGSSTLAPAISLLTYLHVVFPKWVFFERLTHVITKKRVTVYSACTDETDINIAQNAPPKLEACCLVKCFDTCLSPFWRTQQLKKCLRKIDYYCFLSWPGHVCAMTM